MQLPFNKHARSYNKCVCADHAGAALGCLLRGDGVILPKSLATAARAIKFASGPEKVAQRGWGGGAGATVQMYKDNSYQACETACSLLVKFMDVTSHGTE